MSLDILSMYATDLGPTRHYGKRRICFIPASKTNPEYDGRCGNLTTVMQPAKTGWGRRLEVDTYLVSEQSPIVGIPGRVFLLVNATDDTQEQPYQTVVGPKPQCTCKASRCRVTDEEGALVCKHHCSLRHLIENELL